MTRGSVILGVIIGQAGRSSSRASLLDCQSTPISLSHRTHSQQGCQDDGHTPTQCGNKVRLSPSATCCLTWGYSTSGPPYLLYSKVAGPQCQMFRTSASPFCLHVDCMKSAMVGVLTPQKWANTSNPGTVVETGVPEAPPPGGCTRTGSWPRQLAWRSASTASQGLAPDKYGCTPGGSRLTPHRHPHPPPAGSLGADQEEREGGRAAAVCLSLTSSGPRLAVYYMSPFLPLYS